MLSVLFICTLSMIIGEEVDRAVFLTALPGYSSYCQRIITANIAARSKDGSSCRLLNSPRLFSMDDHLLPVVWYTECKSEAEG